MLDQPVEAKPPRLSAVDEVAGLSLAQSLVPSGDAARLAKSCCDCRAPVWRNLVWLWPSLPDSDFRKGLESLRNVGAFLRDFSLSLYSIWF